MSDPLTAEEEAEIRKMDATFEQDNPNDYARPDWLVGLLHERRRLLATLDAARALPAPDERQAGLREDCDDLAAEASSRAFQALRDEVAVLRAEACHKEEQHAALHGASVSNGWSGWVAAYDRVLTAIDEIEELSS